MTEFDFDDLDSLINNVLEESAEATPEVEEVAAAEPLSQPEQNVFDEVDDVIAGLLGDTPIQPAGASPTDPTEDELEEADSAPTPLQVSEHVFTDMAEQTAAVPIPKFTSDELMDAIDIRNFATLVTLNTSRWNAKVKDHKAAKDAAQASGADAAAFEARKRLLVGADDKLKAIHKAIDVARTEHYRLTLPWSVVGINDIGKRAGSRMLPNTLFMDYTTTMAKCKMEMDAALNSFVPDYPSLVMIAQQNLGSSFNPSEYPNPASIRQHFDLSFDFNPIPVGADFKGLQAAQAQKLSTALDKKTRTMLENAMQEAWTRLYESVEHAFIKLSDPDAMFHYTMADKLKEQCKLLKHLNVTKDIRIEEIRAAVDKELTKHDVKDIRKDDALRKRLAESAKEIFDRMKQIGATP